MVAEKSVLKRETIVPISLEQIFKKVTLVVRFFFFFGMRGMFKDENLNL